MKEIKNDLYEIDTKKMIRLAKELGIEVTENSKTPGFYLTKNGQSKKIDVIDLFAAIFPEIKELEDVREFKGDDAH
ncbi:hypothetical protein [Paenibacillus silvae]|uniref:Uncharacterized protein n=1 Tax=Paenibacillus silvae TaxID=1325358 RepID=A0A2W6NNG3_9BACL|nr:hypothetical protein [Paenibacillus silvae]PZT57399.1 hypothetical protein DN757_01715 [Paenibacillus silvae]